MKKVAYMGQLLDDEFLCFILLSDLTSEYDSMVLAIEISTAKMTRDSIKAKLLQDDKYGIKSKDDDALFQRTIFKLKKMLSTIHMY